MESGSREFEVAPLAVPPGLSERLIGYDWFRDTVGMSGGAVHRLSARGRPRLYLKHGRAAVADEIAAEFAKLRWLRQRIAVPDVEHFLAFGDEAWLLTTALPGRTACQLLETGADGAVIVDALAAHLRILHQVPVDECPFEAGHPLRLRQAHARMIAGEVDVDDFGEAHQGWSPERLWREMVALTPSAPDRVVTHGDYSLDNLLIEDGRVTGCIDVGRAGVADRHQDLAILCDSLDEFDGSLGRRLLDAYGLAAVDDRKLRFHLMLDEFF